MNIFEFLNENTIEFKKCNVELKIGLGIWFYLLPEISTLKPYLNSDFHTLIITL